MSENKLIGHNSYLENFVSLYKYDKLPSKILISGKKGIGKSLLINNFLLKIFNSNNDHELITNMTHPNILNIKKTNDKNIIPNTPRAIHPILVIFSRFIIYYFF